LRGDADSVVVAEAAAADRSISPLVEISDPLGLDLDGTGLFLPLCGFVLAVKSTPFFFLSLILQCPTEMCP
jgi:hypothetical protein